MNDLLRLIQQRQSSRVPFNIEKPLSLEDIKLILEAGRWSPTAHNMQNFEAVVVDDKRVLNAIQSLHYDVSEIFIHENYRQLSFSEEELKRRKTGLLATMFPKSWLNPLLVVSGDEDEEEEESSMMERHNQLLPCPVLIVLLYDPGRRAPGSGGDFLGIMSLGCVLENMWLMAASLGIGFHVVSSLTDAPVEEQVKQIMNIPHHLHIAVSFRLGYPLASPGYLRVRRDISDFVHHNHFGDKSLQGW